MINLNHLISLIALFGFYTNAVSYTKCVDVDSRNGWTTAEFTSPVSHILSINGQWSGYKDNHQNWQYHGPEGNPNKICDHDICFRKDEYFLKLYMKIGESISHINQHGPITETRKVSLIGNDFPQGRLVNDGALNICFSDNPGGEFGIYIDDLLSNLAINEEFDIDNLPDNFDDSEIEAKLLEYKARLSDAEKIRESADALLTEIEEDIDNVLEDIYAENDDMDVDLEDLSEEFDEDLDWEPSEVEEDFDSEDNYYNDLANDTLQVLQSLLEQNDRRTWLITVLSWRTNIKELIPVLQERSTVSPREWQAFLESRNRVEEYISQYLGEDNWFKDSPVPVDDRHLVEALGSESVGQGILQEVKSWNSLNDKQIQMLKTITLLGSLIKASMQEFIADINHLRAMVNEASSALKEGVECLGTSIAAGDFGDLVEVATGVDICTGEKLSIQGRAISGIGFFIGTARFWRVVANTLGLDTVVKKSAGLISKVKESAKKIGIKGKDLGGVTKEVDHLAKGKVADIYEAVAKNKPLGLGSTGRSTPNNLKEQAAMLVTKADPQNGKHLSGINMTDARWPGSQGWQKWQATHRTSDGKTITIHYVRNKNTGKVDDFKFDD